MAVWHAVVVSLKSEAVDNGARHPTFRDTPHGMDCRMTALERAFQSARSGQARRTRDIIASLKREGYSTEQIHGPELMRQLSNLIKAAHR
jgi:hypothetical protein